MTARTVKEWIGEKPETAIPPRVELRVFDRFGGRCASCTRKVRFRSDYEIDHCTALINGGENREANLQVLCTECHRRKTGADVAEKATTYRKRRKHLGIKRTSRPLPGGKTSPWKAKIGGGWVRRDEA